MIVATEPKLVDRESLAPRQRFVVHQSTWQTYQSLLRAFEDRPIRLTFDRGELELRSPSGPHERLKKLLDRLITAAAEELEIPLRSQGSTTFSREDLDRGLEPDECYYFEHEADIRGRDDIDASDPPPDLAVEVEVSRTALNRMGIYAALGVPEVWRLRATDIRVFQLDSSGQYVEAAQSADFPQVPLSVFKDILLRRFEITELQLIREMRGWIRVNVSP